MKHLNYILIIIDVLLKLDGYFLIWETLYFLIKLSGIADTTQIHPFPDENWSILTNHIKITAVEAMKKVGMKSNTFYRRVKEYESSLQHSI